jgi:hypothetical protein
VRPAALRPNLAVHASFRQVVEAARRYRLQQFSPEPRAASREPKVFLAARDSRLRTQDSGLGTDPVSA